MRALRKHGRSSHWDRTAAIWSDAAWRGPWGCEGVRGQPRVYHKPTRDQVWVSQPPGLAGSPRPPGETRGDPTERCPDPGRHGQETRQGRGAWVPGFSSLLLRAAHGPWPPAEPPRPCLAEPSVQPGLQGTFWGPGASFLPGSARNRHSPRRKLRLTPAGQHLSLPLVVAGLPAGPGPFLGCHRTGACAAG